MSEPTVTIKFTETELKLVNEMIGHHVADWQEQEQLNPAKYNLQKELKHIEDASKPDAAFLEVAQKVQELNQTGKEEEAKELEKKHKDLEDTRKKQMVEVQELLKEESTVQIYTIYSNQLPNDISAEQIMKINKIIIDN